MQLQRCEIHCQTSCLRWTATYYIGLQDYCPPPPTPGAVKVFNGSVHNSFKASSYFTLLSFFSALFRKDPALFPIAALPMGEDHKNLRLKMRDFNPAAYVQNLIKFQLKTETCLCHRPFAWKRARNWQGIIGKGKDHRPLCVNVHNGRDVWLRRTETLISLENFWMRLIAHGQVFLDKFSSSRVDAKICRVFLWSLPVFKNRIQIFGNFSETCPPLIHNQVTTVKKLVNGRLIVSNRPYVFGVDKVM